MSDFEPCDAFSGPRAGCVFKRGTYGLGYYGDADGAQADARPGPMTPPTTVAALVGRALSVTRSSPSPKAGGECAAVDARRNYEYILVLQGRAAAGADVSGGTAKAAPRNGGRRR